MNNSISFQGKFLTKTPSTKVTQGISKQLEKDTFLNSSKKIINDRKSLVKETMSAVGLNPSECRTKNKNGHTKVFNKDGKLLARISPRGKYGINYAYVLPKNSDVAPKRYALSNGEIIFEFKTLSGARQFIKNFKEAVSYNKVH